MTWIKVEVGLARKLETLRLASALKTDVPQTVGLLVGFWCWADSETADGFLPGMTFDLLDGVMRHPGFSQGLAAVGWLEQKDSGLEIPNWEVNNGSSAKMRAKNTRFQSDKRRHQNVTPQGDTPRKKRKCIPVRVKSLVVTRDGNRCRYCGWDLSQQAPPYGRRQGTVAHFDHVLPVVQGGDNSADNVVLACSSCNQQKNGRTPEQAGMTLLPCHVDVTRGSDKPVTRPDQTREELKTSGSEGEPSLGTSGLAGQGKDSVKKLLRRVGIRDPWLSRISEAEGITPDVVVEVTKEIEADPSARSIVKILMYRLCDRFGVVPPKAIAHGSTIDPDVDAHLQHRLDVLRAQVGSSP